MLDRLISQSRLLAVVALWSVGCGQVGSPVVAAGLVNPTGSCGTRVVDTQILVPDCQNPLRRDYWRVRTLDGKHAWTVPRMDGDPRLQPACADANDPLHALVERYDLCAAADSEAKVNIVNNMELADALRLTHFLEGRLRFVVVPAPVSVPAFAPPNTVTIDPFPDASEIVEACALHPNSPDLETVCQNVREHLDVINEGVMSPPYFLAGPTAAELAARMNELYGVVVN